MKLQKLLLTTLAIAFITIGCSEYAPESASQSYEDAKANSAPVPASEELPEPTAALIVSAGDAFPTDTALKIIQTVDLKFRVKDLISATQLIEDQTLANGGYITQSKLYNTNTHRTTVEISADSSLEILHYTPQNELILRIPNENLSAVLRAMVPHIDYLDSRTLTGDEVSLSILSQRLAEARNQRHSQRLSKAIDAQPRNLNHTTTAEDRMLQGEAGRDAATIQKLTLLRDTEYATLTLNVYQAPARKQTRIANPVHIAPYQPGFFSQCGKQLKTGWKFILELILLILPSWPLILIVAVGGFFLRTYMKKSSQK